MCLKLTNLMQETSFYNQSTAECFQMPQVLLISLLECRSIYVQIDLSAPIVPFCPCNFFAGGKKNLDATLM